MIISRTPFRVSFFGGGTDFPDYYTEHGGATLATAINRFCYILAHPLGPFFKYKFRASYARTELVQHRDEFEHPLIRETLRHLNHEHPGLEITHVADLPGRTGLGSSSSFTVGLLHTLLALKQKPTNPALLAEQAIHIERTLVGDPGGHQDQYAAAFGGFHCYEFKGKDITARTLQLTDTRLQELEASLMMFYTGMEMSVGELQDRQRREIKNKLEALHAMKQMVTTAETILTGNSDLAEFGRLLHEAWTYKKSLADGISNTQIDDAYETARNAGALGGKLLGAGGRGFLLVFAEPDRQSTIRTALKRWEEVPFQFHSGGSEILLHNKDLLLHST